MRKTISVIVPVYQGERFIKDCIHKIMNQTYPYKEIIIINDGSTDDTREICDDLSREYPNVFVVHQENGGCGKARQAGLEKATGEYIVFVDADDELFTKETLTNMYHKIDNASADILVANYCRRICGDVIPAHTHGFEQKTDVSTRNFRFEAFFSQGVLAYTWGKMYRRDFLVEHNIHFENLNYAEDKLFNFYCYACHPKYTFMDDNCYIYNLNRESISYEYKKDFFEIWMKIAHKSIEWSNEYQDFVAFLIFFAVFFQGKQEYEYYQGKLSYVSKCLRRYEEDLTGREYLEGLRKGTYVKGVSSSIWRIMMRGFSFCMHMKWYGILSLGFKVLIDGKIDERLSSTGKQKNNK